jgi:hypothetical protein
MHTVQIVLSFIDFKIEYQKGSSLEKSTFYHKLLSKLLEYLKLSQTVMYIMYRSPKPRHLVCYSILKNLHNNQVGVHFFSYHNGHATVTLNPAHYFIKAHYTVYFLSDLSYITDIFHNVFLFTKYYGHYERWLCYVLIKCIFLYLLCIYKFCNGNGR